MGNKESKSKEKAKETDKTSTKKEETEKKSSKENASPQKETNPETATKNEEPKQDETKKEETTKQNDEIIDSTKGQTANDDTIKEPKDENINNNEEYNDKETTKDEATTTEEPPNANDDTTNEPKDENINNNEDCNDNEAAKDEATTMEEAPNGTNIDQNDKLKALGQLSSDLIVKEEEHKDDENEENKEKQKEDQASDAKNNEDEEKKEDTVKITSVTMEDKGSYYFLNPLNLDPEYDRDVVSLLALSDTLSTHSMDAMKDIPTVDILVHAGNFTQDGTLEQVKDFNIWINTLLDTKKVKYAVIIAGNHEVTFDKDYYQSLNNKKVELEEEVDDEQNMEEPQAEGIPDEIEQNEVDKDVEDEEEGVNKEEDKPIISTTTGGKEEDVDKGDMVKQCRHSIKNAIYLQDQGIEILGLKFYGSPWSRINAEDDSGTNPDGHRAFCVATEEEMKKMYDRIPYDVDVMISHYPPYLHNDGENKVGSKTLIQKLYMDVQPKVCIFGHITSCHGVTRQANMMETAFMNVNCSNEESEVVKKPILFYLQPKLESFF